MNPVEELISRMNAAHAWEGNLTLSRNEYLVREGRREMRLFLVESGSTLVFMTDGLNEHSIRFGYPGSLMAALDSFISSGPTRLNIRAIRKAELKWITKESYLRFIQSSPHHITLWNELLMNLVAQQMEREEDLLTSSPQERYLRVLRRSPRVFQEIPHKYIASYLRMTPETLSRIKSLDLDQGS